MFFSGPKSHDKYLIIFLFEGIAICYLTYSLRYLSTKYLRMKFLMNSVIRLIYGQDKGSFRASSEIVPDY